MSQIFAITRKELKAYFGSPMAAIFIGVFLLSCLFSFFWLETFFARNIADIRPLFRWMPLLLIFLVAALTMRQWSEEQKMGTLELLLTLPVRLPHLVLGKFLAVLSLTVIALLLTLGLPITVSFLGNMDWGPVFGGYFGAILMAAAYISVGLFISSQTDNQIISLMLTCLLAGFLFLVGSPGITDFFGNQSGEFLRRFGMGSRFASIERGVIDLRDICYYVSISFFFLSLNILSLDRKRWSFGDSTSKYRRTMLTATLLFGLNIFALNIWLDKINVSRLDLTKQQEYSISAVTQDLISNLPEPLNITGYFSAKTHPLLSPLLPRIKDLMEEYKVASRGKVNVSYIDPKFNEEMEAEANQQYGIKPIPFQVAGRYEAAVVNSYFHILITYGDQYVTLSFDDLIEVKSQGDGQLDVSLRNLEYDLTKSIKKVVYGFQSLATVFAGNNTEFTLISIMTPASLPDSLGEIPPMVDEVIGDLHKESNGNLHFEQINPDLLDEDSRNHLNEKYNITPLAVSLFSPDSFYMHLILETDTGSERIFLGEDMGKADIHQEIEGALKRHGSGFTKTIGIWTPQPDVPPQMAMMQQSPPQDSYQIFRQVLQENYNLEKIDLSSGRIGGDIDTLLLVAPYELDETSLLAVDQYLMRGGAIIALAGNYLLDLSPFAQTLQVKKIESGIGTLLDHYGVHIDSTMVMDNQNEPFPIPVTRDIGGILIQEIQKISYPFFVDIRSDGMAGTHPITSSLPAVTMNWASPLFLNENIADSVGVTPLLNSSGESWLHTGTDIQPDFDQYPESGFSFGNAHQSYKLAVALQGSFLSYFSSRQDPRLVELQEPIEAKDKAISMEGSDDNQVDSIENVPPEPVIKKSPNTSRLIVVGSSEFINDTVINLSRSTGQDRFLNNLQFVQNIIDWSVEDDDLLSIRSRGSHARLLVPMTRQEQRFWEWLNYGLALAALISISLFGSTRRHKEKPIELTKEVHRT